MQVDTGLEAGDRKKISDELARAMADTYVLYLKTQGFHWNVTGDKFQPLHQVFEDQYMDLRGAIDDLAERMRALGEYAPASWAQFGEIASIREETGVPPAMEMVKQLVAGHEAVVKTLRSGIPTAEAANDEATVDLMVERLRVHEKTAWMLRSFLQ